MLIICKKNLKIITYEKVIIHTLNSLGNKYKKLTTIIRARDSSMSFEELYDKLMMRLIIIAQLSQKFI